MKKTCLLTFALAIFAAGCSHDMEDQPPRVIKSGQNMNTAGTGTVTNSTAGAPAPGTPKGAPPAMPGSGSK